MADVPSPQFSGNGSFLRKLKDELAQRFVAILVGFIITVLTLALLAAKDRIAPHVADWLYPLISAKLKDDPAHRSNMAKELSSDFVSPSQLGELEETLLQRDEDTKKHVMAQIQQLQRHIKSDFENIQQPIDAVFSMVQPVKLDSITEFLTFSDHYQEISELKPGQRQNAEAHMTIEVLDYQFWNCFSVTVRSPDNQFKKLFYAPGDLEEITSFFFNEKKLYIEIEIKNSRNDHLLPPEGISTSQRLDRNKAGGTCNEPEYDLIVAVLVKKSVNSGVTSAFAATIQ